MCVCVCMCFFKKKRNKSNQTWLQLFLNSIFYENIHYFKELQELIESKQQESWDNTSIYFFMDYYFPLFIQAIQYLTMFEGKNTNIKACFQLLKHACKHSQFWMQPQYINHKQAAAFYLFNIANLCIDLLGHR